MATHAGRLTVNAPSFPTGASPTGSADDELRPIRDRIQRCVAIVMLGFVAAVSFHYWIAAYEEIEYPRSTYLYRCRDAMSGAPWEGVSSFHCFGDLYGQWRVAHLPTPYTQMPWGRSNYLPFAHVLMAPFAPLPYWAVLPLYLACCSAGFFCFCRTALHPLPPAERTIAATALGLMSYPPQILMDRGNVEAFVFLFLALFYLAFTRGRMPLAALSLAAAIDIKGYPVLLSLLFLNRGLIRPFVLCGLTAVVLNVASASMFEGGALRTLGLFLDGVRQYGDSMHGADGIHHGSSLWGLFSILQDRLDGLWPISNICRWLSKHFGLVQAVLAVGLLTLFLTVRLALWEGLTLGCCAMMAMLTASPDYRLVHFLIPIVAFCISREPCRRPVAYATLFGLLLIPKAYISLGGELSSSSLVNPLIMLAMAVMITRDAILRSAEYGPRPYVAIAAALKAEAAEFRHGRSGTLRRS